MSHANRPTEQALSHDPLCERAGRPRWDCDCDLIAQVRADEREKAAQRLEAPDLHHEWCDLGRVSELMKGTPNTGMCDCYHAQCISAARGEA